MKGGHLIRHWSSTQSTVTLPSAEAELGGNTRGASTAMGLRSVAADLCLEWTLTLQTDSTANRTPNNTNTSIYNTFVPTTIGSVVTTPSQSDNASAVSEIALKSFQILQDENRQLRRQIEVMLSRLPPQQTGTLAGSILTRQGGPTAGDMQSSAADL